MQPSTTCEGASIGTKAQLCWYIAHRSDGGVHGCEHESRHRMCVRRLWAITQSEKSLLCRTVHITQVFVTARGEDIQQYTRKKDFFFLRSKIQRSRTSKEQELWTAYTRHTRSHLPLDTLPCNTHTVQWHMHLSICACIENARPPMHGPSRTRHAHTSKHIKGSSTRLVDAVLVMVCC